MPENFKALRKDNLFYPTQPSTWQRLCRNPPLFIAQYLYNHLPPIQPFMASPSSDVIRVVCVSDTHNETIDVPDGDILIHAGDLTQNGTFDELQAQLTWLASLPHQHKIVIAGNHDLVLDSAFVDKFGRRRGFDSLIGPRKEDLQWGDIVYLDRTSVSLHVRQRKINVFGSPMTPEYGNWAFQYLPIRNIWTSAIPKGTDIVVTHGPPKGHLDRDGAGCSHLNRELWRVKPRLAVWGHIHHGRGEEDICWGAVQRMHDDVLGAGVGGFVVFWAGLLGWVWQWILWSMFRRKRKARTKFVNAALVGHWGIGKAIVVEI